jgi:hypothetical protein
MCPPTPLSNSAVSYITNPFPCSPFIEIQHNTPPIFPTIHTITYTRILKTFLLHSFTLTCLSSTKSSFLFNPYDNILVYSSSKFSPDRTMVNSVRRRPPTVEDRFRSQLSPREICVGQSGTRKGFLVELRSSSVGLFHQCPFRNNSSITYVMQEYREITWAITSDTTARGLHPTKLEVVTRQIFVHRLLYR